MSNMNVGDGHVPPSGTGSQAASRGGQSHNGRHAEEQAKRRQQERGGRWWERLAARLRRDARD